jgi:hypothetical protein
MKNQKRTEWRRFRLCSFEIAKEISEHCPTTEKSRFTRAFLSLICTLGLAFIGPTVAHAGGFKMQQQRRALPYAGRAPVYHGGAGGAYNFSAYNVPSNRSALIGKPTGISTQNGVQGLRHNMNQPYQRYVPQIGVPTPALTPRQVLPRGTMTGQVLAGSARTTNGVQKVVAGSARTTNGVSSAPVRNSISAGSSQVRPGPSSAGAGGRDAAITMGSSQLGSYPSSVGADSTDATASTGSIGIDPTGQFQQNRRIQGSDQWQGSNYQSFRNYRSEWHDRNWWRSHYSHIVFGAAGWYYWKAAYWYPAWGYDPEAHYAYDGPIYAYNDLPPDQVIANAQAALRPQGYYQAEPDGLLGPVTREAIVNYQRDHGLYETSTIDLPTSQSLGMK